MVRSFAEIVKRRGTNGASAEPPFDY